MKLINLSPSQERLLFVEKAHGNPAFFKIPFTLRIKGNLDKARLEWAIDKLFKRQEILKLKLHYIEEEIKGSVLYDYIFKLKTTPITSTETFDIESYIDRAIVEQFPEGMLVQIELLQATPEENILLIIIHHVIADDWSIDIFLKELSAIYNHYPIAPLEAKLAPLNLQYSELADKHIKLAQSDYYQSTLLYWQQQLKGAPETVSLPFSNARPLVFDLKGEGLGYQLSEKTYEKIIKYCNRYKVTVFSFLLAAFISLIHRCSNEDDIIVGYPCANRLDPDVENLIGLFVNILPLRVVFNKEIKFSDLVKQIQIQLYENFEHQDVPFDKLVQATGIKRHLNAHPIFQMLFTLIEGEKIYNFGNTKTEKIELRAKYAKLDLSVFCTVKDKKVNVYFVYSCSLFKRSVIEALGKAYKFFIKEVLKNPSFEVAQIPLVGRKFFSQSAIASPNKKINKEHENIINLFEKQTLKNPDKTAIIFQNKKYSFKHLSNLSVRVASFLKKEKIKPNHLIALSMEPSIEYITILIGILRNGGSYIPLDPHSPPERLSYILKETNPKLFITSSTNATPLEELEGRVINLKYDDKKIFEQGEEVVHEIHPPNELLCVIYTSGSTGSPKGVMCQQKSLINRIKWHTKTFATDEEDIFILLANLSFVDALGEIFLPLLSGRTLIIPTPGTAKDPESLIECINNYRITRLGLVPSLLRVLLEKYDELGSKISTINHLEVSGEPFHEDLIKKTLSKLKKVKLINRYGSTEATSVIYNVLALDSTDQEKILVNTHIIANTEIHILDKYYNPLPEGLAGDLYISGASLAAGYFKNPFLTKEKFININLSSNLSEKIYKTGDIGVLNKDKSIDILGRKDDQVKVNGFRVEPREVELVIEKIPAVKQAIVFQEIVDKEQNRLVACLTLTDSELATKTSEVENNIREELSKCLPVYMIPAVFIFLDEIPHLINGKVDYQALKNPLKLKQLNYNSLKTTPRNYIEYKITQVWGEILKNDHIGMLDDFFQVGGNSLLAIRVLGKLQKELKIKLPITFIYQNKTIQDMAKIMLNEKPCLKTDVISTLNAGGSAAPLFLIHPAPGFAFPYSTLAKHLGNHPIYGINDPLLNGMETSFKTIQEMAEFYLPLIYKIQNNGPYILGGWSFGGAVALEIAYQMWKAHKQVEAVLLFDSSFRPPHYYNEWTSEEIAEDLARIGIKHDTEEGQLISKIMKKNGGLLKTYNPCKYKGRIILFKASGEEYQTDFRRNDYFQGWLKILERNLEICSVKGTHKDMMNGEYAKDLCFLIEKLVNDRSHQNVMKDLSLSTKDAYLHYAAQLKDEFCIERLISIGADIFSKDAFGITALEKWKGYDALS